MAKVKAQGVVAIFISSLVLFAFSIAFTALRTNDLARENRILSREACNRTNGLRAALGATIRTSIRLSDHPAPFKARLDALMSSAEPFQDPHNPLLVVCSDAFPEPGNFP